MRYTTTDGPKKPLNAIQDGSLGDKMGIAGNYTANIDDISDPSLIGDIARNARGDWGDWRVPVKPSPGIDTKGRGGFFLHGGRISGSAGCIDFGGGRFGDPSTDKLKKDILNDPDGIVPITVH